MSTRAMPTADAAPLATVFADADAFRRWYDDALPRVYGYVLSRCGGDPGLAEELTQQTFSTAVRRHRQFEGRADSVTWLCAIARSRLVDHYRREGRDRRRHEELTAGWRDSDRSWEHREEAQAVEAALAALPGEQRIALVLRYLDGLPVREVAALLGRTEKAAESLLSRSRDAFRRAYGEPDHG